MVLKYLLLLLLIFPILGWAQTPAVDSLEKKIRFATTENEKWEAVNTLLKNTNRFINIDSFRFYAILAKKLANQSADTNKVKRADLYLAQSYIQANLFDSTLAIANKNLSHTDKEKEWDFYSKFMSDVIVCWFKKNDFKKGLSIAYPFLNEAELHKDSVIQIKTLSDIGVAYMNIGQVRVGINWFSKAVQIGSNPSFERIKGDLGLLFNISLSYFKIGKYDSSEYFALRQINVSKQNGDLSGYAFGRGLLGYIYSATQRSSQAIAPLNEALEIFKNQKDSFGIIETTIALGKLYANSNQTDKGIEISKAGIAILEKKEIVPIQLMYASLAENYKAAKNYEQYSAVLEKILNIKDSVYKATSEKDLTEFETKYNVQKKETTILQQKYDLTRQRYLVYGLIGLLALLAITGWFIFKNRQRQQEIKFKQMEMDDERKMQKAVEEAKEEERNRIITDLHDDVGGGLSTIRMVSDLIADQKEQTQQLEQYAHKISDITKEVTQRMNTIVWALSPENDNLQNLLEYIRGYGFRFFEDTKTAFECDLPGSLGEVPLSGLRRKNIFLCVKEALNNVYKHSGADKAWVNLSITDGLLTLSINDNGKGFSNNNQFGNGLKNIQKRMLEINAEAELLRNEYTSIILKIPLN